LAQPGCANTLRPNTGEKHMYDERTFEMIVKSMQEDVQIKKAEIKALKKSIKAMKSELKLIRGK